MRCHCTRPLTQILRKSPLLTPFSGSYSKFLTGLAIGGVTCYLGWLGVFRSQQEFEISSLVSRNDNNSMPLWAREDTVVNLR